MRRTRKAYSVACAVALFSLSAIGAEVLTVVEPGAPNAPGPALDDSLVAFRWHAADGATGYRLVLRDLDSGEAEEHSFATNILFSQISLIAGHRYRWHLVVFVGTNIASTSATNFFSVAIKPVYPVVSGVLPNPVPALDGAQALVINGKEFRRGSTFVLRDKSTGESFRNLKMAARRNSQFVVTPNFTKAEGPWSVEVINPGGFSSGEFVFDVLAPSRLGGWRWRRSGWPWTVACLVGLGAAGIWIWRERSHSRRAIALAEVDARQREHERMSRDLHDSVNDLNPVNLLAGKLKMMVETDTPPLEIQQVAAKISFAIVEAINGVEDIVWAGRQENDKLDNLVARLRYVVGRFRESNPGVTCDLELPLDVPERSISPELSAHLLRITAEALRNVIKHSAATQVRYELLLEPAKLTLMIRDNGRGFSASTAKSFGRGHSNARRRAEEAGGTFNVESAPGDGTKVIVELPLR